MRRHLEQAAWEAMNRPGEDSDRFRREILPRIQTLSIRRLATATGLSLRYCAQIRNGERVPHEMWWLPLEELVARTGAAD
jgi:hypothetical protein